MKPLVTILGVATIILFQGCHKSHRLSEPERVQMFNQIQQMFDAHSKSVESEGLQGSLRYLYNSREFRWTYQHSSISYDVLVSRIKSDQVTYQYVHLQWDSLVIEPLTAERVSFSARYRESSKDTTGKESFKSGLVKGELIHISDGWKFYSGRAE